MKKILLLLSALFIYSCATANFAQTGPSYPKNTGFIKVLYEFPEDNTYEEIGIVSSVGGSAHGMSHLIKAMQKKAAKYGADCIVIVNTDKTPIGMLAANQYGVNATVTEWKNATAVAIKLK